MLMKFALCAVAATLLISAGRAEDKPAKPEAGATAPKKAYRNLDPNAFDKMRKEGNTVVLDVRTRKEYEEGHIAGAVLIDFNSPDFEKEIGKLDKNKTYLVHCAAGGRSARACKKMGEAKFSQLFNLDGGMGAWEKAGKPVEK